MLDHIIKKLLSTMDVTAHWGMYTHLPIQCIGSVHTRWTINSEEEVALRTEVVTKRITSKMGFEI